MAGKGAPKGNQYAKKGVAERGITFSYYLDVYEYDLLKQSLIYEGKEPTIENIRAKAKQLTKAAINEEMQRVFARYKQEHSHVE